MSETARLIQRDKQRLENRHVRMNYSFGPQTKEEENVEYRPLRVSSS